ncbi:Valyl/Leucyl/Isoleucyl-tRNA synthetase [Corynascus novoguineensis]|uniref:valine--tRNA ligase n=1 Tax=Corynascus novoguineensis TaxID=1126955 RepID=A0AAN7CV95_9PEZI|nr:Valyl/Leucyl/Isoleucyl-tRNA synthetase [Corynascus novoguineensis]
MRHPAFGVSPDFKYSIDGTNRTIEVATTRLETILADSGIAFSLGLLFIVEDSYVDPEFGTGMVKLTPAHDLNDYNLGERQNLECNNILNEDGTINENAGPMFQGQKKSTAR